MIDLEQAKQYLPKVLENFLDWACIDNYVINKDINPEYYMRENAPQDFLLLTQVKGLDLTPAVEGIANKLPKMDIARGSISGFFIGLLGERGFSTKTSTIALLDHFIKMVDLCISFKSLKNKDIQDLCTNHPNEYKASIQMPLLSTAVMSRITTDCEFRDYLRQKEGLPAKISSISSDYGNTQYIPSVLSMAEKEIIIILHLELNKGCEVEIEQMDNNFQLFTWFQMELYHQGLLKDYGISDFKYNQSIDQLIHRSFGQGIDYVSLARCLFDIGIFGYYTYPARTVNSEGETKYNKMMLVFGEENIYQIPKLDGKYVILLSKNASFTETGNNPRAWNGAYIGGSHQNLVPKLKILKQLSPKEIEEWKLKIDQK